MSLMISSNSCSFEYYYNLLCTRGEPSMSEQEIETQLADLPPDASAIYTLTATRWSFLFRSIVRGLAVFLPSPFFHNFLMYDVLTLFESPLFVSHRFNPCNPEHALTIYMENQKVRLNCFTININSITASISSYCRVISKYFSTENLA